MVTVWAAGAGPLAFCVNANAAGVAVKVMPEVTVSVTGTICDCVPLMTVIWPVKVPAARPLVTTETFTNPGVVVLDGPTSRNG